MESQLFEASGVLEGEDGGDSEINVVDEPDKWYCLFLRYIVCSSVVLIAVFSVMIMVFIAKRGQKTRNPQQRIAACRASRSRPSLTSAEPTIYVSPANLPPPPKYEAMAPPSYEEVVGIHYPGYQPPVQPITQPITAALSQNSQTGNSSSTCNSNSNDNSETSNAPSTVITVTADRRTSVTAATS